MTEGHGVGQGRPARCPGQRTGPQAGRWAAGGSRRSLVSPDTRGRPTDRQSDGGQHAPRPEQRAGKEAESSTAQTKAGVASSGNGQAPYPRAAWGARRLGHALRSVAKMPGKTSSFVKRAWWLAAIAASSSVFALRRLGGRTRVCNVLALYEISTPFLEILREGPRRTHHRQGAGATTVNFAQQIWVLENPGLRCLEGGLVQRRDQRAKAGSAGRHGVGCANGTTHAETAFRCPAGTARTGTGRQCDLLAVRGGGAPVATRGDYGINRKGPRAGV